MSLVHQPRKFPKLLCDQLEIKDDEILCYLRKSFGKKKREKNWQVVLLCMPLISRIQISSYFENLLFSKVILKGKR